MGCLLFFFFFFQKKKKKKKKKKSEVHWPIKARALPVYTYWQHLEACGRSRRCYPSNPRCIVCSSAGFTAQTRVRRRRFLTLFLVTHLSPGLSIQVPSTIIRFRENTHILHSECILGVLFLPFCARHIRSCSSMTCLSLRDICIQISQIPLCSPIIDRWQSTALLKCISDDHYLYNCTIGDRFFASVSIRISLPSTLRRSTNTPGK